MGGVIFNIRKIDKIKMVFGKSGDKGVCEGGL